MFYWSILMQYMGQYMKSRLTYRGDALVEFISDLFFQGMNLIFIIVVFGHIPLLEGWSRDEVIFIYGFFLVPFALFATFFNIWDFNERYIINGEMDRVLTRPVHSLFQIVLERMELESVFGAFTGMAIMWYAGSRLGITLTFLDVLVFIVLVLSGMLVYGGLFVSISAIGFWSDSKTGITPMMYNIGNYGRYPVNIYNKVIRFILTWVLPFAFVGVYPASYFLDRDEWLGYTLLTPLMGILFFSFGVWLWNTGVKRYRGVGN